MTAAPTGRRNYYKYYRGTDRAAPSKPLLCDSITIDIWCMIRVCQNAYWSYDLGCVFDRVCTFERRWYKECPRMNCNRRPQKIGFSVTVLLRTPSTGLMRTPFISWLGTANKKGNPRLGCWKKQKKKQRYLSFVPWEYESLIVRLLCVLYSNGDPARY